MLIPKLNLLNPILSCDQGMNCKCTLSQVIIIFELFIVVHVLYIVNLYFVQLVSLELEGNTKSLDPGGTIRVQYYFC
jgi:hypothetical protein